MLSYVAIGGAVLVAVLCGLLYWEYHENSILQQQNGAYEQALANAKTVNADNAAALEKLQKDAKAAADIISAVDGKQLVNEKTKDTIVEKVHDAPPNKCTAIPAPILVAVNGMYQQRAGHAGAAAGAKSASAE